MALMLRSGWTKSGASSPDVVHAVGLGLDPHGVLPAFGELFVAGALAQQAQQVELLAGEQAAHDLAFRRDAGAAAVRAERLGDGGDDSHGAQHGAGGLGGTGHPASYFKAFGGGAVADPRIRAQHVVGGEQVADLRGGDHVPARPAVVGVERHLLDEAQLVARGPAPRPAGPGTRRR